MLDTPTTIQGNPQPPADWFGRFCVRLSHLHPDVDPEVTYDLAGQLWAVQGVSPESAAEIVSTLMPADERDAA